MPKYFDCWRCFRELQARREVVVMRMVLCPMCRNKRCPKASDHRLDCSGSNLPGQAGSVYLTRPPDC